MLRVPAVRGFAYVFEFRGEGQGDPQTGKNDAADGRCTRGCDEFQKKKGQCHQIGRGRERGASGSLRQLLCRRTMLHMFCVAYVML